MLINITGGYDLTLFEMDEAANAIREQVDEDANIIVGSTLDPEMEGTMRVSVVATGIDAAPATAEVPQPRRRLSEPVAPAETQQAAAASVQPRRADVPAAGMVRPVAPAPRAAPVAAPTVTPAVDPAEPAFFDAREAQEAEDRASAEAYFGQAPQQDDLPPPAYEPAATPRPMVAAEPQRPAPGTPSVETMQRLRAAVMKGDEAAAAGRAAPRGGDHQGRFGIGSLIGRMTGGAEAPAADPSRGPAPMGEAEEERIEIPAFLRRQAN